MPSNTTVAELAVLGPGKVRNRCRRATTLRDRCDPGGESAYVTTLTGRDVSENDIDPVSGE